MTRLNERSDIIIILLYHFLEVTKQQLNRMNISMVEMLP